MFLHFKWLGGSKENGLGEFVRGEVCFSADRVAVVAPNSMSVVHHHGKHLGDCMVGAFHAAIFRRVVIVYRMASLWMSSRS